MTAEYRPVKEGEVPIAVDVFLQGLNALTQRHGLPEPRAYTPEVVTPLYRHLFTHGIFYVAEAEGRVIGICAGVLREDIWFLSMFWLLPEARLQGVGKPLLQCVLEAAKARGAARYFTWSSIDFGAVATYMKQGWLPQGPIFTFAGEPSSILNPPTSLRLSALEPAFAEAVDAKIRGAARPQDHAFFRGALTGEANTHAFQVWSGREPVGYFYLNGGAIGPAAWLSESVAPALLAHALCLAQKESGSVKLAALGMNTAAISAAQNAGLKIVGSAHLLMSGPIGKLSQYIPSGPGLF
jgi:GNAT superfamily N-acetyltransferase